MQALRADPDTQADLWRPFGLRTQAECFVFEARLSAWQTVIDHLAYRLGWELPGFNPFLFHRACGDDRKLMASGDVEPDNKGFS